MSDEPEQEARKTAAAAGVDAQVVRASADVDAAAKVTAGQRRINLIWESTQAGIALSTTLTTLVVASLMAGRGDPAALSLLSNAFFLVIGFYFSRTNHQKTGGVRPDDTGR